MTCKHVNDKADKKTADEDCVLNFCMMRFMCIYTYKYVKTNVCGGISRNMSLVFVADNFRNEIFFFMLIYVF